uniref:Putative secreted peptide n=1 Tax=Anopheles braziliensis TaxID=58242 RepID=A0A2M3ZSY5_9DIPT
MIPWLYMPTTVVTRAMHLAMLGLMSLLIVRCTCFTALVNAISHIEISSPPKPIVLPSFAPSVRSICWRCLMFCLLINR